MPPFLYETLATRFRENIETQIWPAGTKLPSIRKLSESYNSSVISVQTALQKLEAAGLIQAKPRSGFYVINPNKSRHPQHVTQSSSPKRITVPDIFYHIMQKSAAFDISPGSQIQSQPSHIEQLNRHINRAMRAKSASNALYYAPPAGDEKLRQQISQHYLSRNLFIDPEQICITSGCQNALFLALSSCCKPGDTVAIESPAFYGALQILQKLELNVIEVPSSPTQGVLIERLEQIASKWQISAFIVTPNFNTPTGSLMPDAHKQQVCALAAKLNFNVIEDDVYGDLGFHHITQPLKAFDKHNKVILCGSFSKSLSRDLGLGWLFAGEYHAKAVHFKMLTQLSHNNAIQQGLASFISEGYYRRHLFQYKQSLLNQRNHLIELLNQHWQFEFNYTTPEGGLCLWLELAPNKNSIALYNQALEQNIVLTPGALFSSSGAYQHFIRLSFVHEYSGKRLLALKQLGSLINQNLG